MRKRAREVIGENAVVVKKVALTFPIKDVKGGEEVRMRPFGYIPDLWAKVVLLLEQNERYNSVTIIPAFTFSLDAVTGMGD